MPVYSRALSVHLIPDLAHPVLEYIVIGKRSKKTSERDGGSAAEETDDVMA
jgi:hypothetical protein